MNTLNKFNRTEKKKLKLTNIFLLNSIKSRLKRYVRHVKIFTLGLISKVKGIYFIKLIEVYILVIVIIFLIKSHSKN